MKSTAEIASEFGRGIGLEEGIVFAYWSGSAPLPEIRQNCIDQFAQTAQLSVFIVRDEDIEELTASKPLPTCFQYLCAAHKADILRIYLLHHYGGGWTDVKQTTGSWHFSLRLLQETELYCVGYPEVGPSTVSGFAGFDFKDPSWWQYTFLRLDFPSLIGNGALLAKHGTPLLDEIHREQMVRLNDLSAELRRFPASHPKDRLGLTLPGGSPSRYPVPWTHLLGSIVHPKAHKYRKHIGRSLPSPDFRSAYQHAWWLETQE